MLARESYFERELTLASGRASKLLRPIAKRTPLFCLRGAYLAGEPGVRTRHERGASSKLGGMGCGSIAGGRNAVIAAAHRHGANLRGFFLRAQGDQSARVASNSSRARSRPGLKTGGDRRYDHDWRIESAGSGRDAPRRAAVVIAALALVEARRGRPSMPFARRRGTEIQLGLHRGRSAPLSAPVHPAIRLNIANIDGAEIRPIGLLDINGAIRSGSHLRRSGRAVEGRPRWHNAAYRCASAMNRTYAAFRVTSANLSRPALARYPPRLPGLLGVKP